MHAHERGAWRRPDLAAAVATAAHPAVLDEDFLTIHQTSKNLLREGAEISSHESS